MNKYKYIKTLNSLKRSYEKLKRDMGGNLTKENYGIYKHYNRILAHIKKNLYELKNTSDYIYNLNEYHLDKHYSEVIRSITDV